MTEPLPSLTCLIVDDNEMNRLTLAHYVDMTPGLCLAAALPDGLAALTYLQTHPAVDVLLLDIAMPNLTGLDLIQVLPRPLPAVVLVTSHDYFAVQAFALPVSDYVVKPIEYPRFLQAIRRVQDCQGRDLHGRAAKVTALSAMQAPADPVSSDVYLRVNGKLLRLNFDDVLYIEAVSDYVNIATVKHKYVVHATLKSVGERLSFSHFMRVHRSYIANLQRIDAVEDYMLQMGPYEVPVSKSYQVALRDRLSSM